MTRNRIQAAALHEFAYKGYEGTPLSEIAKEVGIKTPSFYAHFRSKESLLLHLYDEVLQDRVDAVRRLMNRLESAPPSERLFRILVLFCHGEDLSEEKLLFLKRLTLFPPPTLEQEIKARFLASERLLSNPLGGIFQEAAALGEIRPTPSDELLASYYCLIDGCFVQRFYYPPQEAEHRLTLAWRIFWNGIKR
ncbi:TetR/AcrR family transcriptional regulator [Paenibacillus caseinilyticus]|uniref:TetR/AcrR family transcriptional regulator n=1 Tax=Paenibacillus caseinilyticus TaxID=3098138 RepID=UPI0022B9374B|nr:TetR/AcrR family transcriptional regulator [Paenibacillus caseinilyticus]MCZ8523577.1 TetR/AcrR family transcriptional regulator [Paenibacillus caseinilyticus]